MPIHPPPASQRARRRPASLWTGLVRRIAVTAALLGLTASTALVAITAQASPAAAALTGRDLITGTWATEGDSTISIGPEGTDNTHIWSGICFSMQFSGGWDTYEATGTYTECRTGQFVSESSWPVKLCAVANRLYTSLTDRNCDSSSSYHRDISMAARCIGGDVTWERAFADVEAMKAAGATAQEITDYQMYPCSGYKKCKNGTMVTPSQRLELVNSLKGIPRVTDEDAVSAGASPCVLVDMWDGQDSQLETLLSVAPEAATVTVAGSGAPKGRYAVPAKRKPDGTATACPYYHQQRKLAAKENWTPDTSKLPRWARNMWRNTLGAFTGNWSSDTPSLRRGDVLLQLSVGAEICTNGSQITSIDPPAGGDPRADYKVDKGKLFGYEQPTSLAEKSHNYIDAATQKTFVTRGKVAFINKFPDMIKGISIPAWLGGLATKTFEVKITIYQDGTWDYATSG